LISFYQLYVDRGKELIEVKWNLFNPTTFVQISYYKLESHRI